MAYPQRLFHEGISFIRSFIHGSFIHSFIHSWFIHSSSDRHSAPTVCQALGWPRSSKALPRETTASRAGKGLIVEQAIAAPSSQPMLRGQAWPRKEVGGLPGQVVTSVETLEYDGAGGQGPAQVEASR